MKTNRSIAFHTLGCKLNFAETSAIGKTLIDSGYRKAEITDGADVLLLNTCSVTVNADRECKSIINKALKVNPETVVVVTGCYAQLKPEVISEIEGVDLVLGANEKFNAPKYINELVNKGPAKIKACDISEVHTFNASHSSGERTRTFLKVQDGCDYSCTFCTIPLARGASRSNTIENVVSEVKNIVQSGTKEIVLTGVNLGDYGIYDNKTGKRDTSFFELSKKLNVIPGLGRVRISSIEPNLLEDEIIDLVANSENFMPHFHIPLQSGSDKILKLMRRRYLTALYREKVEKIKTVMPNACIGVDVIVGFPGEGEEEFMETYNFIKDIDISYLHVFTYSERDHTPANEMIDIIPLSVRKQRNKMLRILSDKKQNAFYHNQIGTCQKVLFEADNKDGFMHGFTENYIKVRVPYQKDFINEILDCKLNYINEEGTMDVEIISLPVCL